MMTQPVVDAVHDVGLQPADVAGDRVPHPQQPVFVTLVGPPRRAAEEALDAHPLVADPRRGDERCKDAQPRAVAESCKVNARRDAHTPKE